MASQQQASNTPINERDLWQTPDYVFAWAHRRFTFDIDLACNDKNKLCTYGISDDHYDALNEDWLNHGYTGFCNPPYSNTGAWLKKAYEESEKGFESVFLTPLPNGENQYRDHVFGKAAEIIVINGRLAFVKPDGTPVSGNTRGSCFIVYRPFHRGQTSLSWVNRDDMRNEYEARRLQRAAGQ